MDRLPAYAELLGLNWSIVDGRPLFVMPFSNDVLGRPGYLHGGAIAGLLEIAAYAVLRTALADKSVRMKPIGVTVDFLRGGTARETRASGTVKRLGKRVAHVEATAWQEDETKPIATARMNVLLVRT